jgi:hypothetical protein
MQSTGGLSHLAHRKQKVRISESHIDRAPLSVDRRGMFRPSNFMASALSSQ